MPKTQIRIDFLLPTTSIARVADAMTALKDVIDKHRGEQFMSTMTGPIPDDLAVKENTSGKSSDDSDVGRRASSAAAAFDDDGEPKRKRGRPPGSTKASGTASRKRSGDDDAEDASADEGDRGAKSDGTRKVAGKGASEGEGRGGRSDRGGSDQRRNSKSSEIKDDWADADDDAEDDDSGTWADDDDAAEEEATEEDFAKSDEPWPDHLTPKEIDRTVIQTLLGDHYKATGGKDRGLTFNVMDEAVGERQLGQIDPKKYRKLAKALLKDIAKYTYGLKKAK